MEVSRSVQHHKHSDKINAVVQVHSSLRNSMLPKGPLHGQADVIYMTNIASSSAIDQPNHPSKEVDELMFLLPHRPDTIRFWIDERPVGHPDASKEKIRKGQTDDAKNCSVIKVCINRDVASKPPPDDLNALRESDIYLPPSPRAARVWIYLDPAKQNKEQKGQESKSEVKENTQSQDRLSPRRLSTRRRASTKKSQKPVQKPSQKSAQKPPQKPAQKAEHTGSLAIQQKFAAPTQPWVAIPERRSSKKATPRSPLSTYPPINGAASPPKENPKNVPLADEPIQKTDTTRLQAPKGPSPEPEPEDFKNNIFNDISRLMTKSDPFGRFHNTDFPELTDSEEERDTFPTTPLDGDVPTLGQAQLGKFYKAGRRAQSSVFFEEEHLPGQQKIEISHDEKAEVKQDFTKPSRRRKLKVKLSGMLYRRRHH